MEISKYVQSGVDYQYEQYLVGQAIEQCETGEDTSGLAARFLKTMKICPHCYKDFDTEFGECRNPECINCIIFPGA